MINNKPWLATVVGRAVLANTTAWLGVDLIATEFKLASTSGGKAVFLAAGLLLPTVLAAYWMFRKLQTRHPRDEARSVAVAFALPLDRRRQPVWVGGRCTVGLERAMALRLEDAGDRRPVQMSRFRVAGEVLKLPSRMK